MSLCYEHYMKGKVTVINGEFFVLVEEHADALVLKPLWWKEDDTSFHLEESDEVVLMPKSALHGVRVKPYTPAVNEDASA